jgi:AmiR/NasT family two-component response regulator
MKTVRVLVANRPRLIRELVMATISDQSDIEIVGEVPEESEIESAVDRSHPDFLIVALEKFDRLPMICQLVLQRHPEMRVIAIAPDRNCSMFYWASLRIQSNQIESSEAGVLSALRGQIQPSERLQ